MTRYVVRERALNARNSAARPTVWDVTESHTRRPVPYGVHTTWARAHAHAERLRRLYVGELAETAHAEEAARATDRDRIAANRQQDQAQEEAPKPRPARRARRRPTAPRARTTPWDGTLTDAADIIARIRATGGTAAYTCADPAVCWRKGGNSSHAIRVTAPAEVTVWAGDMPPSTVGR